METIQAIYNRRAIRNYTGELVDEGDIKTLLDAAIHAPSAMDLEPWAFVVVQDRAILKQISDRATGKLKADEDFVHILEPLNGLIEAGTFDIFYNAGALIVICAKPEGQHPDWDCCFAGQNLMLAARSMGLGTCPIGFAWTALDDPDIRKELQIPEGYRPILPIIVGHPVEFTPGPGRRAPQILAWLRDKEVAVAS